ncbi:alcohol dehydrogenase [Natribacillus halophilus]|uniref:Alcohol dehydrogenase n=1 Tax=Natribacillus halophilus TaxID=549003 RepID=A0A1G8KZ56_9BACI|nr:alcohol dehydrogenase [Natribacillus halophilus]
MKQQGKICILSDGNKEQLQLQPTFYEKELHIIGSSDGWDYQKHARWFFQYTPNIPYIDKLFEYEINKNALIKCFDDLNNGIINPLKVLVRY